MRRLIPVIAAGCLVGFWGVEARGEDWPTYLRDVRRSGISPERIKPPLWQPWVFTATHPPEHAWGDPQSKPVEKVLELPRLRFDDAFHVAAAGGRVYFGSSADNKVYALDARTGQVLWEFYTDGPVRLAPTVWKGKVYVGSDDGFVYCLGARDGRVVWTFRAAPADQRVLGSGKMISVWPVRTGVVVDEGPEADSGQAVAYFGAGVFPGEGLYLYAVGADDGKLIWKNDSYARGGAAGISPQGYLVASKGKLFAPACRTMPAAFDRKTGRFLFHRNLSWRFTGLFGGTYWQLADGILFGGTEQILGVHESTGRLALAELLPAGKPSTGVRRLVVAQDAVYLLTGKELVAVDREGWIEVRSRMTALRLLASGLGQFRGKLKVLDREYQRQREGQKLPDGKLPPRTDAHEAVFQQIADLTRRIKETNAEYKRWAKKQNQPTRWRSPFAGSDALIMTEGMLLAGGPEKVTAFEAATGEELWSGKVSGKARGLAVADGRVFVSTDTGSIHCFQAGRRGVGKAVRPAIADKPFPQDARGKAWQDRARRIVAETGVKRGYALILGEGSGRLACALAKSTELMIYVVGRDADEVSAARKALTAAGVYGKKVVVMRAADGAPAFSDYFANLIVCEEGMFASGKPLPAAAVLGMLKPCGGVACVRGAPKDWLDGLREALAGLGEKGTQVTVGDGEARVARGPLAGAGSWTHQYAEPGNTACGDDRLVKGPIGILWYGEPGPGRMANRHASPASPLAVGGRMFVQGEDIVMAYDAYNGVKLWDREIEGATRVGLMGRCSNLAADDDSVFVAVKDQCLRLDAATGRTRRTYRVPPGKGRKPRSWEYVARVGATLFGSTGGQCVFALDVESGSPRWAHEGKKIEPRTICIGGGRVYFIERSVTKARQAEALKGIRPEQRVDRRGKPIRPDVRLVVALDAKTGRESWVRPEYVADCVRVGRAGGELILMYANNVLLLCGQPWNGHFWRDLMAGEFSRRSLIALSGDDGRLLWSGRRGYRSRPLIVGDRIVAEPWAYDLQTGAELKRAHPLTGAESNWQMSRPGHHCGNIVAAPSTLFFRSGVTGHYDLIGDYGTAHFGAQRPGCWVNCIPAAGLVLMPEAASGCVCAYALQCTTVFQPRKANRLWGQYSAAGPALPVKHLAVNFGAPGDRKDSRGTLWLAYPRPRSYEKDYDQRLVLDLKIAMKAASGKAAYFRGNADFLQIDGSDAPWVYGFGCTDYRRCSIPLIETGGKPATYTVRLYFAAPPEDKPGGRVFQVMLQDRAVLKDFDIVAEAGGPRRAVVKEFKGIPVAGDLAVSMKAAKGKTLLCGIEVMREAK